MPAGKDEHMRAWAAAARTWAEANAEFAEASREFADLTREAAAIVPAELAEAEQLREYAARLDERAGTARADALDVGAFAATLRGASWTEGS